MKISEYIVHEWKTRLSKPAAILSVIFFMVILIYGSVSGGIERDARFDKIAAHELDVNATMESWFKNLKAIEENEEADVSALSGSALYVEFASFLWPGPLSDFAIGQSDLLPNIGVISLRNPDIRLFSKYEFDDPVSLALGSFDISKALIIILPLLLIVLSFDILSSEKDTKRLGLTLAQGIDIKSFFWRRLLIRSSLVLIATFLVAFLVLILQKGNISFADRMSFFSLWMLGALAYGIFWISIISFITSKNRGGEANVIILLLLWSGFTLILPAGVMAVTETIYPTPSRLAYMAEAREMENEARLAEADIANQYVVDHPELFVENENEIPSFVRSSFLVASTMDKATRPVVQSFEQAVVRRAETLDLLRFLSPAIIAHSIFTDVAGTSTLHHQEYLSKAREFKATYAEKVGPLIVAGQRLNSQEFEALPKFMLNRDRIGEVLKRNTPALIFLFLMSGVLLNLSNRRLHKIKGPND